jgi:Right handed beta helix region
MSMKILRAFTVGSVVSLFTLAPVELASAGCSAGVAAPRCSCGDTVDSDTSLTGSDPVTQAPCTGTGLSVNAGVTLNFNNRTIQGSGLESTGTGVIILGDGVRILTGTGNLNSTIKSFATGVSGTTNNSQIRGINIRENTESGIDIAGNSNIISGVHAVFNDGNGITIAGDTNAITTSEASSNGEDGINITGNSNVISTNQVFSNGDDGMDVAGDNNAFDTNSVGEIGNGNVIAGIRVEGSNDPVLPIGQAFNNRFTDNRVYANGADGIVVSGAKNRITSNRVGEGGKGNGGNGIVVEGDLNLLDDHNSVFANGMNGIAVHGDGNTVVVNAIGDKAKGNGGDGIQVIGASNRLAENKVYANLGDGIEVSGGSGAGPNLLIKNAIGDRGKGNRGNGIFIHDDLGNGTPNPVELDSNIVKSNILTGIFIDATATGHELKKNSSGGSGDQANGRCAFFVAAGNFNATGNSANGKGVSGADGTPFPSDPIPTGCVPVP